MKKLFLFISALLCAIPAMRAQEVNYDENKVGPYTLEDPLTFVNGDKVLSGADWELRRAEIKEIFSREMFGKMPPECDIFLEELESGDTKAGYGLRRQVRMWFRRDRTGPKIDWLIITPKYAKGPVPVVMFLNFHGNQAIVSDPEVLLTDGWLRPDKRTGVGPDNKATEDSRGYNAGQDRPSVYPIASILARGYAIVTACYGEVSPDPDRWQYGKPGEQEAIAFGGGVFNLWEKASPEATDNTTSVAAWAWALMRGMDIVEMDKSLDASKVVVTGCSRLGKTALLAGAFDERFAVVAPVQTGGGGATLAKRNYGENVVTENKSFPHWYCRAYRKYASDISAMHFDQHLLLSLVAPRPLLVMGFDQPWFDTKGEYLAVKAASPVWEFLGYGGMPAVEWPDDYDTSAIGECLGYVRRNLEHGISAYDWKWMLDFADRQFGR